MKQCYLTRLRTMSIYLQRLALIDVMNGTERLYSCNTDINSTPYFLWAIKHCGKAFGSSWRFNNLGMPYLVAFPDLNPLLASRKFFGLSNSEVCALFMPGHSYQPYNLPALKPNSTPGDVAHQIHWFIVRKEQELKYRLGSPKDSVL